MEDNVDKSTNVKQLELIAILMPHVSIKLVFMSANVMTDLAELGNIVTTTMNVQWVFTIATTTRTVLTIGGTIYANVN